MTRTVLQSQPPTPETRPGRIAGLLAEFFGVLHKPWFYLLARDALLFLAFSLAILALDNPVALWKLWWPLPLALAASALTLLLNGASPVRWRYLLNFGLFALPLAVRAWFSLQGTLPAVGLREVQELSLILSLGVALWLVASCHPGHALGAWLAAIGVGAVASGMFVDRETGFFRLLTLATLAWGVVTASGLGLARLVGGDGRPKDAASRRFNLKRVLIDFLCLLSLGVGLAAGWEMTRRQLDASLRTALAIQAGLVAQRALWLQSLIFGWGGRVLEHLIPVVSEPVRAITPPWGGFTGALARGGLAGIGVLLVWCVALNRQVRRASPTPWARVLSLIAAMAAFFMLGLLALGAPRPRLALFILAGWLALALIKPLRHAPPARGRHAPPGPGAAVFACALLAVLAGVLALPLYGQLLTAAAQAQASRTELANAVKAGGGKNIDLQAIRLGGEWVRQQLLNARDFNPFDPAIPVGLAMSYRKQMGPEDAGDEVNYLKVVRFYEDARKLDPYDTSIPLALANFQNQFDRQEEAFKTVSDALVCRPHSQELLDWVFGTALRLNQNALADRMLAQALALNPMSTTWWLGQYKLARRIGQGPLAAQALAVALTGAPASPDLVELTWSSMQNGAGLPAGGAPSAGPAAAPGK